MVLKIRREDDIADLEGSEARNVTEAEGGDGEKKYICCER
jgi:hypothetical protein